ncbi:MAG: GAF domain-containing protein [Desulfuromonas sp.]|nr:GAF domain-containing protein [Desulfuromonas sp.]
MDSNDILASTVTELADTIDDLLEALSALQRLSELPAHKLTESTLLKDTLRILYQYCHTTSCTIVTWATTLPEQQIISASKKMLLAIDSNGIVHQRIATPIEGLFISKTIEERMPQKCSDCTSIGDGYTCMAWEKSIVSVPIFDADTLTGIITISHSTREHFNPWWHNLMETMSRFIGQQLTLSRLQQ